MKKESTVKFFLRLTITLLLITAVVAALLALVNDITEPRIREQAEEKTQQAIEAVLPGGGEKLAEGEFTNVDGIIANVYKGENGYAVEVAPGGFDGAITMMVGIDNEGKILGISVISQTETAGLGAICAATNAKGVAFRDQYIGLSGSVAVDKDGGEINAISGATITSRAVCTGVNAALDCVKAMG